MDSSVSGGMLFTYANAMVMAALTTLLNEAGSSVWWVEALRS